MLAVRRAKLMQIAAVAGPGLLVGAMRLVMTPGEPIQVNSGTVPVLMPVVTVPTKLSPEQQRATDWVAALDLPGIPPSPLHRTRAPAVVVSPDPEPVKPPPPADPLAGLKLTGTMGTNLGGLATINGRIYKIGDTIRPGCKLVSVDTPSNTVELETEDGERHTLGRRP